jgi:hypothetical protein
VNERGVSRTRFSDVSSSWNLAACHCAERYSQGAWCCAILTSFGSLKIRFFVILTPCVPVLVAAAQSTSKRAALREFGAQG